MRLAQCLGLLEELFLEHGPHALSTAAAAADQPNSAARKALDHRDRNLFLKAASNHLALAERDKDGAAHGLEFRFSAASAYRSRASSDASPRVSRFIRPPHAAVSFWLR